MRKKISMPTVSLLTAQLLFNVSSVALIVGALAVFAGTIGTVWMGSVKERYGDERTAANEAETATANAEAAKAKEGAALANERAAALEVEAATARKEQEALKLRSLELEVHIARIGPRELTENQVRKLREASLAESFKPLVVFDFASDPESQRYAQNIANIFGESGFSVKAGMSILGGGQHGITVYDQGGVIARILNTAQIQFRLSDTPQGDGQVHIEIGQKPAE